MRRFLFLLTFILMVSIVAFSQSKNFEIKESAQEIRCANIAVVFENTRVKDLKGRIDLRLSQPITFQIYKIKENEFEKESFNLIYGKSPIKYFETDAGGNFRVKNFPEGYYVLKFGTSDGGWNCTGIAVQISGKNKDRNIEVSLELGT